MWLEAYLSNGKIMKSNVEVVKTKMSNEPQSPGNHISILLSFNVSLYITGLELQ